MDGASFLAYCKEVFKRTDKDTEIYTATADTVMDMRSRMLSDDASYVSTTPSGTLSIGDYKISVPSDFGHIIGDISLRDSASDTVYQPIKKISKEEYDQKYAQNLSATAGNRHTGVPQKFCYYGREIYVAPAVDKTTYEFTMNYSIEDLPTYTAVSAAIPFTDQFREVVRAGVLYRMFINLGFTQEAANWNTVYEAGINRIVENDLYNSGASTESIKFSGV